MGSTAKLIVSVLSSVLLAACSTELFDQSYSPYPSEFDPGNGVVTIFRESHFVGIGADAIVGVGGRPYGDIGNGAGIRIGLPPGNSVIDIHTALTPGHLQVPITIEPGKEYYVEIAAQASPMYSLGAIPYLLSTLKSGVKQYCSSGWCAAIEDKTIALPKIDKIAIRERVRKSSF